MVMAAIWPKISTDKKGIKLGTVADTVSVLLKWSTEVINIRKQSISDGQLLKQAEVWESYMHEEGNNVSLEKLKGSNRIRIPKVLHPWETPYFIALVITSSAVVYNVFATAIRIAFPHVDEIYVVTWKACDTLADLVYLSDIIVQTQKGYMGKDGNLVSDRKLIFWSYVKSVALPLDVIAFLPALYLQPWIPHISVTEFRLLALVKIFRLRECSQRGLHLSSYPNLYRVAAEILFLIIIVHWNACFYYFTSAKIGLSSDRWVLNGTQHNGFPMDYLGSVYWVAATLSTVGGMPFPVSILELLFVIVNVMLGVLFVANLVGNVATIVNAADENTQSLQNWTNEVRIYMEQRNITKTVQKKVCTWMQKHWEDNNRIGQFDNVLSVLPEKTQTQINMNIHLKALRKVRIFQTCESGLLVELVNKLKLELFCPGDSIVTRGEIGREMYFVKSGQLIVVGFDGKTVLTTLNAGAAFGELALLNIPGTKTGNRRTATVLSKGYTYVYVLSKEDLWQALETYPEARAAFMKKGREILIKDGLIDSDVAIASNEDYEMREEQLRLKHDRVNRKITVIEDAMEKYFREMNKRIDAIDCALSKAVIMTRK